MHNTGHCSSDETAFRDSNKISPVTVTRQNFSVTVTRKVKYQSQSIVTPRFEVIKKYCSTAAFSEKFFGFN